MENAQCPRCRIPTIITPEGLYVCPRCGIVLGEVLVEAAPKKNKDSRKRRNLFRRRATYRLLTAQLYYSMPTSLAHSPSPDPLVRAALAYLRLERDLFLGRKPKTLEAIAYIIVKLVEGYGISAALREAARRYNVSEKTLRTLVSKYRSTVMLTKERVAESWRRSKLSNM